MKRYENIGNNCGGSIFNTVSAPVDDKRVRKALAFAMQQEELIAILGGEGSGGIIVPSMNMARDGLAVTAVWAAGDPSSMPGPLRRNRLANQFAAMPSLHFGWSIVIAVAVVRNRMALPLADEGEEDRGRIHDRS